jgi:hypothetical protein
MDSDIPLIYTSKGNLPVDGLDYKTSWEIVPGEFIKFVEVYRLGDEIVKENAHVYSLRGLFSEAQAAQL